MRLLLLLLLTLNLLNAQKIALLIGNSQYIHLEKLSSPSKDIPALAQKLRGMNFKVTELYDLDEKKMKKAIKTFKKKLYQNPNAIALFYYSGHGSQAYGESYLIPVDGDTRDEADVEADGVKVETIARKMANAKTKANILFLDACRDVPTGTMGGTKGLGQVKNRPSGSLIVYSTSKNHFAKDDRLFNQVVLNKLSINVPLTTLANDISYTVDQKTGGLQIPEVFVKSLPTLCLSGSCKQREWIIPIKSICKSNGGKIDKQGFCEAKWQNAKRICNASGGNLPIQDDFTKEAINCGGIPNHCFKCDEANLNRKNSSYQSCYRQKGFSSNQYWVLDHGSWIGSKAFNGKVPKAIAFNFNYGGDTALVAAIKLPVLCIR